MGYIVMHLIGDLYEHGTDEKMGVNIEAVLQLDDW